MRLNSSVNWLDRYLSRERIVTVGTVVLDCLVIALLCSAFFELDRIAAGPLTLTITKWGSVGCAVAVAAHRLLGTLGAIMSRRADLHERLVRKFVFDPRDFHRNLLLRTLMDSRLPLLTAKHTRGLTPEEAEQLILIESHLDKIESAEAEEFEHTYPQSRAGRIEAALDRLEASIASLQQERRAPR